MAQDITKTGKQNYRQLQEQNAKEQSGTPDNGNNEFTLRGSIANFRQRAASEAANEIAAEGTPRVVKSPIFQRTGGEDYVGNSMWDEDLYYGNNLEDPNNTSFDNTRGENQWGIAQLGAGIGKGIALAGTTFVDGLVGLGYGLITGGGKAINEFNDENKSGLDKLFDATAGLFDNDVSNAINEVTKDMEQILPNYRTDEENDNPWYSNLGTANFWGDSFIKNLGFTVGAFYSGNALNKALKAAHVLKSGIGASVAGSLLSAVNEGRIEANNTMHDYQDLEDAKTKDAYDKRVGEILDSDLTDAEKNAMLEDLDANYQAQLQDNAERSRRAGVIDLALNVPILTLSNFYSLGRLYARGFGNAERKAAGGFRFGREHADQDIARRISRNADGTLSFKKYGTASKLWRTAKIGLSEGNEELAQQMASNFGGDIESYDDPDIYYKALVNPDVRRDTMDTMGALIKSFDDSYLDLDQWEQFAVGALTGLMGMPTFGRVNNSDKNAWLGRGKAIALSGGAPAVFGNLNEANTRGEQFVNQINDFEAKYRKKVQDGANPFVLSKVFTDAMSGFAEDQDEFNFQNMSDNDMFAVIQAYGQTGRLDDLASLIDMDFENMSDEQLEKIAKSTTTADNTGSGWKNPDGSLMSDTEEGREKMRSKLIEKRDKIKAQIKSYEDALESVRAIGNNSLPDDAMQELAWLKWKTVAFGDRLQQVKKENKSLFDTLRSNFENRVSALEEEKEKMENNGKPISLDEIIYDNDIVDKEQYRLRVLTQLRQTAPKPGTKMPDGHTLTEEEYENGLQESAKKAAEDYEKKMLEEGRAKKMNSLEANDIQRKNLTDAIEVLDYLLEGNVSDKLKGMLKDNKRINELFNVLGQAIYYDDLLGDDLTEEDFEKARTAMRDAIRITTARRTFMKRLNEYRKDPLALLRNRRKIDNETAKNAQEQANTEARRRLNNSSVQDIIKQVESEEASFDDLDSMVDSEDLSDETNANRKKIADAKGIIDTANRAERKVAKASNGVAPETIADFNKMLRKAKYSAESPSEVLDISSDIWTNPQNLSLTDADKQALARISSDSEREAFYKSRIDAVRSFAQKVKKVMDDDAKIAGSMSAPFDNGQNPEPRGGKASRASNDTDPFTSSGNAQVVINKEKRLEKAKELAKKANKEALAARGSNVDLVKALNFLFKQLDEKYKTDKARLERLNQNGGICKPRNGVPPFFTAEEILAFYKENSSYWHEVPGSSNDEGGSGEGNNEGNNNDGEPEEPTPSTSPDDDENKALKKASADKTNDEEEPRYDFWKPTTTEVGIENDYDDKTPFHEILKTLFAAQKKIDNKEALTEQEQKYYDYYVGQKHVDLSTYTEDDIKRIETVYNYLRDHNAFKNASNVKVGQKIHFEIRKELNDAVNEAVGNENSSPIILMVTDDGTIVGDLMSLDDKSVSRQDKLVAFEKTFIQKWRDAVKENKDIDKIASDETVTVAQKLNGRINYTNAYSPVSKVLSDQINDGEVRIGVINSYGRLIVNGTKSAIDMPIAYIKPGMPLIVYNYNGHSLYIPVVLDDYEYKEEDAKQSGRLAPLYAAVSSILSNKTGTGVASKLRDSLQSFFNGAFYIDTKGENIVVRRKEGNNWIDVAIIKDGMSAEDAMGEILKSLNGKPMHVSIRAANQKEYVDAIFQFLKTDIDGDKPTLNDWFVTNPVGTRVKPTIVPKPDKKGSYFQTARGEKDYREKENFDKIVILFNNLMFALNEVKNAYNTAVWSWVVRDLLYHQIESPAFRLDGVSALNLVFEISKLLRGHTEPKTVTAKNIIKQIIEVLKDEGYKATSNLGKEFTPELGEYNEVTIVEDKSLAPKTRTITDVEKPSILRDDKVVQKGKFTVTQNLSDEKKGNDISKMSLQEICQEMIDLAGACEMRQLHFRFSGFTSRDEEMVYEATTDPKEENVKEYRRVLGIMRTGRLSNEEYDRNRIEANSSQYHLTKDGKYYEDADGNKYARVTSFIAGDESYEAFPEELKAKWGLQSSHIGTGIDELTRSFFDGKILFFSSLGWICGKSKVEDVFPNVNERDVSKYLSQLYKLKKEFDKKGITIIPRDVTVAGNVEIERNGEKTTIPIAGTLDLLGYDKEGNWYIFDMKTYRSSQKPEKWAMQLSLYAQLLGQKFGIKVKGIYALPIQVDKYAANDDINKWELSTEEKHWEYPGVENDQLILNGNKYTSAKPVLQEVLPLKRTEPKIVYDKLPEEVKTLAPNNPDKTDYDDARKKEIDAEAKKLRISVGDYRRYYNAMPYWFKENLVNAVSRGEFVQDTRLAMKIAANNSIVKFEKLTEEEKNELIVNRLYSRNDPLYNRLLGGRKPKPEAMPRVVTDNAKSESIRDIMRSRDYIWLKGRLSQFTTDDRLRIVHGLIRVKGNRNAWGKFEDGVITLSDVAAKGTLYHEAFHAVSMLLLTDKEHSDMIEAARKRYGDKPELALEEDLAEDFRRYMQRADIPVIGAIIRAFRIIRNFIYKMFAKPNKYTTANERFSIRSLFFAIDRGDMLQRPMFQGRVSGPLFRRIDDDIRFEQDFIDDANEELKKLPYELREKRNKALDQATGKWATFYGRKYKRLNNIGYLTPSEAQSDIPYNLEETVEIFVDSKTGRYGIYVMGNGALNDAIRDRQKELREIAKEHEHNLKLLQGKVELTTSEEALAAQGDWTFYSLAAMDYYNEHKYDFDNLSKSEQDYIAGELGINPKEYDEQSPDWKEQVNHCSFGKH